MIEIELIKFIVITTLSIFIINLIMTLDKDFNVKSYIYGIVMGTLIGILYYIF